MRIGQLVAATDESWSECTAVAMYPNDGRGAHILVKKQTYYVIKFTCVDLHSLVSEAYTPAPTESVSG